MPALVFRLRWPDGQTSECYSPSRVVKDFIDAGTAYALTDFMTRMRSAYAIADQRVLDKYGFNCTHASAQLAALEAASARFASHADAQVAVLEFAAAS
jgi:uncharacterized repeat protein (TIGR04042 family)